MLKSQNRKVTQLKSNWQTAGIKPSLPGLSACLGLLACWAALHAQTAPPASVAPPTVGEARAFLDRANAALLASNSESSRAGWIAATYINDDSETLTALAESREIAQWNQFIAESHRFDSIQLPPDLARQIMLLRAYAEPAPSEPSLRLETRQLAAQLAGMYGKGKYCVGGDTKQCLGIDDLDVRMAKSRDPRELLELWTGWHAVGAPMRPKYARFVELSNQGARELGVADTGALWRSRTICRTRNSPTNWSAPGRSSGPSTRSSTPTFASNSSRSTGRQPSGPME